MRGRPRISKRELKGNREATRDRQIPGGGISKRELKVNLKLMLEQQKIILNLKKRIERGDVREESGDAYGYESQKEN